MNTLFNPTSGGLLVMVTQLVCEKCGGSAIWWHGLINPNMTADTLTEKTSGGLCADCDAEVSFITQGQWHADRDDEYWDLKSDEDRGT